MLIDFDDDFADLLVTWQLITYGNESDTAWGAHQSGTPNDPVDIEAVPPQPVNERDLVKDQGGEFVRDLLKTYTGAEVNVREGNGQADRLIYGGVTYEVYKVEHRVELGNYRKVLLRKIQGDR